MTTSTNPTTVPADEATVAMATRTRAGMVSLVAAAVSLALARTMANDGGSPDQRLHQMSGQDARVTVATVLAVAGFAALIPGFLAVAAQVRRRGARTATIGSALVVAGGVGFAVLASVDASTLAATHVTPARPMADFLHQLDASPAILVITGCAVIGYFFGPFLVTLSARRAGFVPRWLPWGILGSLIVQPIGAGLGGPAVAHLLDALCQLVLVVMVVLLARCTLASTAGPKA
jgi:hypothetical protein